MSRLTISLPDNLHNRIASLAIKSNHSLSATINQLIQVGLYHWLEHPASKATLTSVEEHCQQLIIQMNALIKNMAGELLHLNHDDFEQLQQAAIGKYNALKIKNK